MDEVKRFKKINKLDLHFTLLKYAKEESIKQVKELFEYHPQCKDLLYTLDGQGLNVLHHVTRQNRLDMIKYFIEVHKMNVNCLTSQRLTPLHFAARALNDTNLKIEGYDYDELEINQRQLNKEKSSTQNKFASKLQGLFNNMVYDQVTENDQEVQDGSTPETDNSNVDILPMKEVRIALANKNHVFNEVVEYLIKAGASMNSEDSKGWSPIHYAVDKRNHSALLELIRNPNTNIDDIDKNGNTALHKAAAYDYPEIVRILVYISNKICYNFDDESPLTLAIKEDSVSSVKILLKLDEYRDFVKKGRTPGHQPKFPIITASLYGREEIFEYLCNNFNPDLKVVDDAGRNIFHAAVKSGNYGFIQYLNEKNLIENIPDKEGFYPIHTAAKYSPNLLLSLINILPKGEINRRTWQGQTALHFAIEKNLYSHLNVIDKELREENVTDHKFNSLLSVAAKYNATDCMEILFENEKNKKLVNIGNIDRDTPFHLAVKNGHYSFVESLLKLDIVNLRIKNEYGQTALHIAAEKGYFTIMELILKKDPAVDDIDDLEETALHKACFNGRYECVDLLIKYKANLSRINYRNYTPLSSAARNGHLNIIELLIKAGAEINTRKRGILPALHAACKNGRDATVEYLLEKGADPSIRVFTNDITIKEGSNALDIAIESDQPSCASILIWTKNQVPSLLRNRFRDKNGNYTSTLRELIKFMPNLAAEVFDWSITTNDKSIDNKEFSITYDFELLDDSFGCWNVNTNDEKNNNNITKEEISDDYIKVYDNDGKVLDRFDLYDTNRKQVFSNHPLNCVADSNDENLLNHPLVEALLVQKWKGFGFAFYYINLWTFMTLMILFNVYMLLNIPPHIILEKYNTTEEACNDSVNELNVKALYYLKIFILFMSSVNLLKELYQIIRRRLDYLLEWDNYFELFTYISAILVVLKFNDCQTETGLRLRWQWQLGSLATLCFWLTFCIFLQKLPTLGLYVIMFLKVTKTFIMLLMVFLLLVMTYAFPYYTLFTNHPSFTTPLYSIMKTIIMTTGEIDYQGIFYNETYEVYYPIPSYIIFFSFIILMNIILMNLTVGLAIDDIGAIMSQAKLNYEILKIKMCLETESSMPLKVIKYFHIKSIKTFPNRPKGFLQLILNLLFRYDLPDFRSARWTVRNTDGFESKLKSVIKDIKSIKLHLKDIESFSQLSLSQAEDLNYNSTLRTLE